MQRRLIQGCATVFFTLVALCGSAFAGLPEPSIVSVELDSTNVLIKIHAPAGLRRLTIEGRSRLEGSSWSPKAVKRFDHPTTEPTEITVPLPRTESVEILRVRADETEPLPARFFQGTNQFANSVSTSVRGGPMILDTTMTGIVPTSVGEGSPTQSRAVVESDIWKVSGDLLYFFNNNRGLQVIDISNPAAPNLKGVYPVAASGEQMYVLETGHAVLLTRNWCYYNYNGDQAKILVIDPSSATPTLSAESSVPGWILESRLVGNALYVASQSYRQRDTPFGPTWEYGTVLTSIDLSNPASPVTRSSAWLNISAQVVAATDRFLFASGWDYLTGRNDIQIVDISSPTGEFQLLSTLHTDGYVADKFKINVDGDILSIFSWRGDSTLRTVNTLENFSLADPARPVRVGALRIAPGEQLYATRFDGKRAYVVTYLRIDPLWIIDLSDPAQPAIVGELHVPGWSTYLQPMGDRVLALGIDDTNSWKVALSLFDVSNLAKPSLLSKVTLGENYSWSEANSDEKALTVLPGDGLVLVPWQGQTTNGYATRVQLIDFSDSALSARGQIADHLNPRRANLHRGHVISISAREFISYDATDRDHPVLKARLDLAWPVNKVLLSGDHLLEIETGLQFQYYGSSEAVSPPTIRVAHAGSPDRILATVALAGDLPIVGADIRGDKLHVAQARSQFAFYSVRPPIPPSDGTPSPDSTGDFILTIWDLANLPAFTKISEATAATGADFAGNLNALWVKDNLLVWGAGNDEATPLFHWGWGGWGWGFPMMPMVMDFWMPWSINPLGGRFVAFDVSNVSAPAFKSVVNLTTNGSWNFSKPFVAGNGLLYVSHQTQEIIPIPIDPTVPTPPPGNPSGIPAPPVPGIDGAIVVANDWNGQFQTTFLNRHFLDALDFTDAASPVLRKPVNIPGHLKGVSHQGGILYTVGSRFDANGQNLGQEFLDASAYDGINAYLVDSISLTNWQRSILVRNGDVFVSQTTTNTALERWRLSDEAKIQKLSATIINEPVSSFRFFGDLAAAVGYARIFLFNAQNPADWIPVGEAAQNCNGGADLQNADGALGRGLWLPQSDYGVLKIGAGAPAP